MTTCLGKSYSFALLCVSFLNVYLSVYASFPFGFESGVWDLIVLVPDHRLSFYCTLNNTRKGEVTKTDLSEFLITKKASENENNQ